MVDDLYKIVWTKRSQQNMRHVYNYIRKDSPQNALKVVTQISNAVYKGINNPEYYRPDKFKINNDGSYRAFEKHHYRISYRFTKNVIRILKVIHTKMNPKEY